MKPASAAATSPEASRSKLSATRSYTQGCISIFKSLGLIAILLSLIGTGSALSGAAFAADGGAGKKASSVGEDGTSDEVLSGPFSEYGEFDSSEDEAADEKFFQFGRFFGVGLGVGATTATGNAGRIYQGGFPTVDFRIDYWFDFQFALQIDVQNSKHNYDIQPDGLSDVNLFRILLQVKYYFDTRDLSAPITFIAPHIIAGAGSYSRTDNVGSGIGNSATGNSVQSQNAIGFNFGAGFELTLKPKKTYLQLEAMTHLVTFGDNNDPKFAAAGIPDRSGAWLQAGIAIMWTW